MNKSAGIIQMCCLSNLEGKKEYYKTKEAQYYEEFRILVVIPE